MLCTLPSPSPHGGRACRQTPVTDVDRRGTSRCMHNSEAAPLPTLPQAPPKESRPPLPVGTKVIAAKVAGLCLLQESCICTRTGAINPPTETFLTQTRQYREAQGVTGAALKIRHRVTASGLRCLHSAD